MRGLRTVHFPSNLKTTCGECHPNVSEKMAASPIHGVGGQGLRTPMAEFIEKVYIVAITVIIGLMILHWLVGLIPHLITISTKRPQIMRMRRRTGENGKPEKPKEDHSQRSDEPGNTQ